MSTNFDKSDSENSDGFVVPDRPILDTSEISPLTAEKLTKVREWLQPTAYDISGGEYRKHASSYLLGTGNWLTSSPEYQRWLMSRDDGLLWIKGIPGSGKSVMAAKIIAELAASDSKCPVLYFFFRQIIHANHDPVALLRDWMDQLLERSPVLQRRLYSYVKDNQSLKSVSPDVMWKDLKMALAAFPERIYCVADALDEMDQGNGEFLVSLANLGHWQPDKVKVLITSRPVPGVEVPLHSVPCLKIRLREDKVDNDISRFVEHCLETSQIDRNHWPAIINAVPGNASGLFLYARLAMDAFLEPGVDVETAIAHLPTDLNVLYTGLLREHIARSGVEDHVQNMMLQAATHTTRPLRLLEMAEMIGVVDAERDLKTRKELVKAACGPLLEILADETVSVIHHSFTEYLKGVTRAKDDTGYPALNPATTHEALALTCLRYLQNGSLDNFSAEILEYEPQRPIRDTKVAFCQRYPFLKYASGNWHKHVVAACSASSDDTLLLTEVLQFLDNDHLRRVWCCIEQGSVESDTPKAHVAAKLGLTGYVQALIDRDEDVDFLDSYRRTPLWWAADKGHSDTVQVLIAAGVKVDRDDTLGGYTALHQAARANHLSVVELLLQAGVSPMIRRGPRAARYYSAHHMPKYGKSPLQCACVNGRLETVDAMIKYVKNPRITHWALAWATCSGQSRLVSLLLENSSVDVNIKVHGDTLLYLACGSLDIDTINILLQAGADVTALSLGAEHPLNVDIDYTPEPRGSPTQTCLHGMLQNDNLEIILSNSTYAIDLKQLFTKLFTAGLDVNQRDGAGKTLLHRVTQFPELVELLVSAGADAQAVDINNNTPLHFITNPGVISTLVVNGGADVNAVNKDGQTPLHRTHSEAVMLKLLKYGSDPNILDKNGNSPLHLLFALLSPSGFLDRVALLLRFGADPNVKNHSGCTPLRTMGGNLHGGREIVDCLVKAGADINTVDSNGRTVLFDVAGLPSRINQERVSTLKYLLGAGASKESRDFQGRTISHEIVKGLLSHNDIDTMVQGLDVLDSLGLFDLEAVDNAGNSLLHELCSCVQYARNGRNVDVQLVRLLTGAGLDMSRKNYAGQTPLHLLCARPCKSGSSWFAFDQPIAYAIHKCENIDERDSIGNTALHIASVYEESWCKLLLDAGADPTVLNYDGLTPLHLAARAKQSNIIGMLLKAVHDRLRDTPSEETDLLNATVVKYRYNVYDEPFKVTALFYACMSGRPESVKLLLDAGADPNIGNLFVACATMEQENRLWTEEEHAPRTAIAALRPFDTTRPPRPALEHLSDILHPFASTRLDEILEMLVSAGIELSLLYCAPSMGCGNPFLKAADLHSSYALKCLSAIRKKHSGKVEDKSESVPSQVPQQGLYLFDDKMAACSDDASKSMMRQSGWLQPEGVDFEIFRAAIVRRQYHLITQMVELGCRFLLPGIRHLEYLISHGFASLFDKIAEAETQARLADGEWSAFGDPTKPGLHFREETKQNERAQFDTYEEEARNKMLEYSLKRALPNMDIVQLLVDKYAVNINGVSRDNNTALHIIARGHHWWQGAQALPFFLKSGADIECRNSIGQTPLHLALDKKYLPLGYLGPFHKDVAEVLIHAGADINAVDSQGRSCLDLAGYSTELVDLLISNGAVVRSSSIFAALEADNATALKKLLQAGVGANGRMPYVEDHLREEDRPDRCYLGDDCMTFDLARIPRHEMVPLYYVASKPTFPEDPDTRGCFRTLLKHGADIYATFHVLPTRREVARAYGGDFNKLLGIIEANDGEAGRRSVLHELVRLGKLSKCVIDAVDIDAGCLDSKGCTLLHAVCDSWGGPDGVINTTSDNDDDDAEDADENITAFKQLLAIGCDIQARDNNGQSIVHHMIYSGWKHPFQLGRLKKSLEEISLIAPNLLSAPNASGNTPLHYSTLLATPTRKIITVDCRVYEPIQAQQGLMVELTRLLLRHGASPAGANQDGNSVLHFMARNLDRKDVAAQFAELVRDHGLDVNARNALGETPLMLLANRTAVLLRSCTGGNSGLDYSLRLDSEAAAERVAMLAALGADFQVTDEHGNGLLHLAATDGVQLFKAVMDRGALDPTMENHAHQTAIDVAATYNNNEILALFKKEV